MNASIVQRLALSASLLASACASTPPPKVEPFPANVVIMPALPPEQRPIASSKEQTDMLLTTAPGELSQRLADSLNGRAFVRADVLDGEEPEIAPARDSHLRRLRHWAARAQEAGADAILECELKYDPIIRGEKNGNFWINLLLFSLGGPATYWVKDRTYYADARLEVAMYDVYSLVNIPGTFEDSVRVASASSRFRETSMDFLDRADGFTHFASSIVIPAGFLATDNNELGAKINDEVLDVLSAQIVDSFLDRRLEMAESTNVADFFLDLDTIVLRRTAGDQVRLTGTLLLDIDLRNKLEPYEVFVGEDSSSHEFGEPEPIEEGRLARRFVRVPIDSVHSVGPADRFLRVVVQVPDNLTYQRSYTFAIPATDS